MLRNNELQFHNLLYFYCKRSAVHPLVVVTDPSPPGKYHTLGFENAFSPCFLQDFILSFKYIGHFFFFDRDIKAALPYDHPSDFENKQKPL